MVLHSFNIAAVALVVLAVAHFFIVSLVLPVSGHNSFGVLQSCQGHSVGTVSCSDGMTSTSLQRSVKITSNDFAISIEHCGQAQLENEFRHKYHDQYKSHFDNFSGLT